MTQQQYPAALTFVHGQHWEHVDGRTAASSLSATVAAVERAGLQRSWTRRILQSGTCSGTSAAAAGAAAAAEGGAPSSGCSSRAARVRSFSRALAVGASTRPHCASFSADSACGDRRRHGEPDEPQTGVIGFAPCDDR